MKYSALIIILSASHGGGPRHVDNILSGLQDQFDLFIACPQDQPYWNRFTQKIGAEHAVILPQRKFLFFSFLKLLQFARTNKITLIHSHGRGAGIYGRLLSAVTGIPCIHTFHGIHDLKLPSFLQWLYVLPERLLSIATRMFICVSKGEAQRAQKVLKIAPEKIRLIYNGVASSRGCVTPRVGTFVVVHITRFDEAKNSEEVLRIAKELQAFGSIEFKIVGDGPLRQKAETFALENEVGNVSFLGFQEDPLSLMKKAHLYLSASRREGLPLSVLEAQSVGLPVVASNVIGNNEAIDDCETGFLYDLGEIKDAAQKVVTLFQDIPLWNACSVNAQKWIREYFSLDLQIKGTEHAYWEILKSAPAPLPPRKFRGHIT